MPRDWAPFVAFVARHQRFLLTTHTRPDGDAIGSMMALAEALESLGKTAYRVVPGRLPPRYRFLDPKSDIEWFTRLPDAPPSSPTSMAKCDAIVVVDTGTWSQLAGLADAIRTSPADKFVIDHHQTQDDIGGGRLVDTSAEACGRLICDAIGALGVRLTPTMATYIFAAVSTDTGWFRHANTSADTFELACKLVAAGAVPTEVFRPIYEENTLGRLRLRGRSLDRLCVAENGLLAYSEIHVRDYAETGAVPPDTEDLIDDVRSIVGVELAIIFIEQPEGGVKVSFRSRDRVDVSKLAEKFSGGGHRRAAGATVNQPIAQAKAKVLAAAAEALA